MPIPSTIHRIRRVLSKPPAYILARVWHELTIQIDRFAAPYRSTRMSCASIMKGLGITSVNAWWRELSDRPYVVEMSTTSADLEAICPEGVLRIQAAAENAYHSRVDLLGSGLIELGDNIDWSLDYKSGKRWNKAYCKDIQIVNREDDSDVKFPWELSRMQWMIPMGQAYVLSGDERYAIRARDLIIDWVEKNPYAYSVNWSCTMDVALRLMTWTGLFHMFKNSMAWSEQGFRSLFLQSLYQHADFTARNLEKSDINGNHYTADAAGLVFAGLFFGSGEAAAQWLSLGWKILCEEMPRQNFSDGVNFEASVPYHRLVLELFLLPALYRARCGESIPAEYEARLVTMAEYTAAYSRTDGSVPLWGDADDARALPLGGQSINDHRYLLGVVGLAFEKEVLQKAFSGCRSEIIWLCGREAASTLNPERTTSELCESRSFSEGGFFVLRNDRDHVFVDCGPIGLAGRGGHGHNDILSFEAVLDGVHLVSDSGAYLYTADFQQRNFFRSTASHNTPCVDGEEVNRFISEDYLWFLHDDAKPNVRMTQYTNECDQLVVSHSGYQRLENPVTPVRKFVLDHLSHSLTIRDEFEAKGCHHIVIPLHLCHDVDVLKIDVGEVVLRKAARHFLLKWQGQDVWQLGQYEGQISPSYGVVYSAPVLKWQLNGCPVPLSMTITPMA